MLENIASMFDNMKEMMKKLKKKSYEINMGQFLETNGHYFDEMTAYVDAAEDKECAAKEIAVCFVDSVEERFASGKKNKIASYQQADLNMFAVYFVFPALLKTEHTEAKTIADAICEEWSARFKDAKIGYTDYDTLYASFREKIFGIF